MKKEIEKQEKQELAKEKRAMIDRIIEHILNAIEDGAIKVPSGYNYKNALSMAKLGLLGVKTKHKAPVLNEYNKTQETTSGCTPTSILNALTEMVLNGVSVLGNECYFIAYGLDLNCTISYTGKIGIARRNGMEELNSSPIFKNDIFKYKIVNGNIEIIEHSQTLESRNSGLVGAYVVINHSGNKQRTEVMSIEEIEQSWKQGSGYSIARETDGTINVSKSSVHIKFAQEMATKTVTNRALKYFLRADYSNVENADIDDKKEMIVIDVENLETPKLEEKKQTLKESDFNQAQPVKIEKKQAKEQNEVDIDF